MTRPLFTLLSAVAAVVALLGGAAGCGHRGAPAPSASASGAARSPATSASASASASAKAAAPSPPAIPLSDEMRDFVAAVAEDHKLSGALAKFAAPSLNDHGVGIDPIDTPKVVGTDPSAGDCYVLEGADGPAIHEYLICWDNKQIIRVADHGMK